MITDTTIMIYVKDVAASSEFWQALGFKEVMRQPLGAGQETALLMYNDRGAAIQLYSLEFIRATQPQLIDRKPALLFSADTIDNLYQAAKTHSPAVSERLAHGREYLFTFQDLDENTFTVIGDWVDVPVTEEQLMTFDRNIKDLVPLELDALSNLTEPAYLFFGERQDAWSRRMAQDFPKFEQKIYWINTEGTGIEHPVRQKYQVFGATFIKRASTGQFVKFDPSVSELESFL